VHLGPTEEDRLRVFAAAELARRTLSRGLKLNAPEAIALVVDEMHMAARSGASYEEVATVGVDAVKPEQVMSGVAAIVGEIRAEVLLEEGTRLVVVTDPFGVGESGMLHPEGDVELAVGRERQTLVVVNTSTRPVRVSSHYPFWRANAKLEFDREAARGFRLDIPAGTSVRWAPGETHEVALVAYAGDGER